MDLAMMCVNLHILRYNKNKKVKMFYRGTKRPANKQLQNSCALKIHKYNFCLMSVIKNLNYKHFNINKSSSYKWEQRHTAYFPVKN